MSYDVFKERVKGLVNRSGSAVRFSHEDGRHIARCSDGVTIIGNVSCPRVLVKWGSGHSAYADISFSHWYAVGKREIGGVK